MLCLFKDTAVCAISKSLVLVWPWEVWVFMPVMLNFWSIHNGVFRQTYVQSIRTTKVVKEERAVCCAAKGNINA